jgi:Mce-associated membrane protein
MSTTRHMVNRQRRLAAVKARATPAPAPRAPRPRPKSRERPDRTNRRAVPLPLLLALLAVLATAFAVFAHTRAESKRDLPALRNAALTDTARTSEVKGTVGQAVDAVFSYDHADPGRTEKATDKYLTGKAVAQHREMLAQVRAQGDRQKLVLSTTVTHSGIEVIDGNRARVLVFADQSNTSTAKGGSATHAAAMFAVDVVHRGGTWQIANIDTFSR